MLQKIDLAKAMASLESGNKRSAKKEMDRVIAQKQADAQRSARLSVVHDIGEHTISFQDMWNTTGFQMKMIQLCKKTYGALEARDKFNMLNDVRNDLSAEGQQALKRLFADYCSLGAESGQLSGIGDRSKSMDYGEFKHCLSDLGLYPSKKLNQTTPPPGQVQGFRTSF
jgi:hypothetical protein